MIEVEVDKILPLDDLKNNTEKITQDIQDSAHPENLYVFVNQDAKPIAALINIDYLKKLTGKERIPVKRPEAVSSAAPSMNSIPPQNITPEPKLPEEKPFESPQAPIATPVEPKPITPEPTITFEPKPTQPATPSVPNIPNNPAPITNNPVSPTPTPSSPQTPPAPPASDLDIPL